MESRFWRDSYSEWIPVVAAQAEAGADQSWAIWCDAQPQVPTDEDVRIDSGRADYGLFRRYMVRRSALPVHQWWEQISRELPDLVHGLWFGLADIVQADGSAVRTMHVAGADSFDAGDGGDWASDPSWEPEDRYFVVPEIAQLDVSAHADAVELLVQVVGQLRPQVASVNIDGIAVGFDDGDQVVVWERERWTLWAHADLLGYIDITVLDQPWKHGRWRPTAAFASFAPSFSESLKLLEDDDFEAWEEAEAALREAGVHLRYPDGSAVPESLVHIDGDAAWFRWNDKPFDNSETPDQTHT